MLDLFRPEHVVVFGLYAFCQVVIVHAVVGFVRTLVARFDLNELDRRAAQTKRMIANDYAPKYSPWESLSRNFVRRLAALLSVMLVMALFAGVVRGIARVTDNPWMLWTLLDHTLVTQLHENGTYLVEAAIGIYLGIFRHPWRKTPSRNRV